MVASEWAVAADHREGRFEGAGGVPIRWQAWLPERPAHTAIVIAHGVSEHGGRYGHVVDRLVPEGYALYAPDHRGHGRSGGGGRSLIDRLDNAIADLDTMVDLVTADRRGERPVMLGHSMGGCLAFAYTARHQSKLDALVLSAPLLALEAASWLERAVGSALSRVAPRFPLVGVDASKISRDPAEVRAYEEDPLVFRGRLPARTIAELAATIDTFPAAAPSIELPLLIMHGTADELVPSSGSETLYARAGSPDRALKLYEGLYHEIFNEPAEDRARVLDDLAGWLAARVGPARGAPPVTLGE
jgi:acylglycerol lipase